MTLKQHIANSRAQILADAREYAKNYDCTFEKALSDVTAEYCQGWHDEQDYLQYNGWLEARGYDPY